MRQFTKLTALLLLVSLNITAAQNIRPIVLVHGLTADDHEMQPTIDYIRKHMGYDVYVKSLKLGAGRITSFCNMNDQVQWMKEEIEADPNLKDGFNCVAHSQGGLVARYYIERYNNPRVYTYISWGAPQYGVFGTPGTLDDRFTWLNVMELFTYKLLYSFQFQHFVSFAGYWRDTLHYDKYLKKCSFLPFLNNEKDHPLAQQFKENLCSLEKMVLVQSTAEEIIEPAESCQFGYYKIGSSSDKETMFESELYQKDLLGLKTLYESDRLILRTAHCKHRDFQEDEQNFLDNTLEFLLPSEA